MARRNRTNRLLPLFTKLIGVAMLTIPACAQQQPAWPFASPSAAATPFRGFGNASAGGVQDEPPRDVPLVEKSWQQLANTDVSALGRIALLINPTKWKHAETENFIIHYRRVTEAQKVVREIEYDIWFVAKTLGASKDRYQHKSHVYVFEDEAEWKKFLSQTSAPSWFASFAHGDELFLNVRSDTGLFDSQTLAHETTHAVVARLYPRQRWPVWLSEGFAEYMGSASVAARKSQYVKGNQRNLAYAEMSLDQLSKVTTYPPTIPAVAQLYESSEKFVRYLFNELPKERFTKFVDAILSGKDLQTAFMEVYGDKFRNFDAFRQKYERFSK
jgi:hypothetical protein